MAILVPFADILLLLLPVYLRKCFACRSSEVAMLLLQCLKATLLSTVSLAFITPTSGISVCSDKGFSCLKLSKDDKLVKNDPDNTECRKFTDKILKCAAQSCTKEDEVRYVKDNIEVVCKKCQQTGLCSYGELLAEEEKMASEGVDTGKSSNSGTCNCATLSSSAVVVLLAVLKTAWAVSM